MEQSKFERARAAVKAFRTMQPQLTAYARAITGNPKVRVQATSTGESSGFTDGEIIYMIPPAALGDNQQHDRSLCDRRGANQIQLCTACAAREMVLSILYHEMAHIAFDTFAPVSDSDKALITVRAMEEGGTEFSRKLLEQYKSLPKYNQNSYAGIARLFNEYLPVIANALEDARVNELMVQARPGIGPMLYAKIAAIMIEGFDDLQPDGTTKRTLWKERPANLQAIIGLYFRSAGYEFSDWLHPKIVEDLMTPGVDEIVRLMRQAKSAGDVYNISFKALQALRDLGYCLSDRDPELEQQAEPEQESEQEPEQGAEDQAEQEDSGEQQEEEAEPDEPVFPDGPGESQSDADADPSEPDDAGASGDSSAGLAGENDEGSSAGPGEGDAGAVGVADQDDEGGLGRDGGSPVDDRDSSAQPDAEREPDPEGDGPSSGVEDGEPSDVGGGLDGAESGDDAPDDGGAGDAGGVVHGEPEAGGSDAEDEPDGGGASSDGGGDVESDEGSSTGDDDSVGLESGATGGRADEHDDPEAQAEGGRGRSPDSEVGEDSHDDRGQGSDHDGVELDSSLEGEGPDGEAPPLDEGGSEPGSDPGLTAEESLAEGDSEGDSGGDAGSDEQVGRDRSDVPEAPDDGGLTDGSEADAHADAGLEPQVDAEDHGADGRGDGDSLGDEPSGAGEQASSGGAERDDEGDDDRPASDDGGGTGDDAGSPRDPGTGAHDADADRADSPEGVDEGEPEPFDSGPDEGGIRLEELPAGGLHDISEGVQTVLGHDAQERRELARERQEMAEEMARAILQSQYFESPSELVGGVFEERFDEENPLGRGAWEHAHHNTTGLVLTPQERIQVGVDGDFDPPESVLGPALLRARVAFSDNQRSSHVRNLKSGKVDGRVLGKRVAAEDPRLFKRTSRPGKKDYFVAIAMDVSGSTVGVNLALMKRAVLAQATLLHRVGVKFSIFAHSTMYKQDITGLTLFVYHAKEAHEPWSEKVSHRVRSLSAVSGNLDGHALEFLRKQLDASSATNKIGLYYSDGKMPAANHDEELDILQREIKTCSTRGYTLLGVGIRTDSPREHGLDTVQVDSDEDISRVVRHIERRLTQGR